MEIKKLSIGGVAFGRKEEPKKADHIITREGESPVLATVKNSLVERSKAETKRAEEAISTEFWFALVFQSREQKDAFLKATGWDALGDKYLDGEAIADSLDVQLPAGPGYRKINDRSGLAHLADPLPGEDDDD